MTTSRAIAQLRGVRLGRRERELLLKAPPSHRRRPGTVEGMLNIKEPTRSASMSAQRACRRLADLGLIEYVRSWAVKTKGPSIIRTALGDEVVTRYRRELEQGHRIRWPREENDG